MIYALINGHPAGVDPGECAGICAMMFTNLPHPRIVFLYQRATTSPLTLHSSWLSGSNEALHYKMKYIKGRPN